MKPEIFHILDRYGALLAEVDAWFRRCMEAFPDDIRCNAGCSDCCRGMFDITLTDALFLGLGFTRLPRELRESVREKAAGRLAEMQRSWPELSPPYVLNHRPEEEWEQLMPDDDETPCVLLGDDGRCLVYEHRPMTCRLHGLPLIDPDGTLLHDEWCTLNFTERSPVELSGLRAEFTRLFQEEVLLFHAVVTELFKCDVMELDTFIPLAVLFDAKRFDWEEWGERFVAAGENAAALSRQERS